MPAGSGKKSENDIQKSKRRKSSSRSRSRGTGKRVPQVMISEEIDPHTTSIYPKLEEEIANDDANFDGTDYQRNILSTQTDLDPPEPWYARRAIMLSVIVFAIALFMAYGHLNSLDGRKQAGVSMKNFSRVLAKVAKAYPSISERDRSQLRGAANRWFDSSSNDPVVVVVYTSDSSSSLFDDLVNETASFLDQKTVVVNANEDIERVQLHETFDNTLKGGTKSTIGVRDLEKLTFDAALELHGFEDEKYYVHSRPFIWLQVTRDNSASETSCDTAIERTLMNSWSASGGTRGNIAPIISRILQFTLCLQIEGE